MDPALKKRMIGAAVLIVLAIIFVPMLFSDRPTTRNESVDLSLPGPPERDFKTQVVPLDEPGKPSTALDPDHVATVDTIATKKPDALDSAPAKGAAPPAPKAPPSVPTPTPTPTPAPAVAQTLKPAATAPAPTAAPPAPSATAATAPSAMPAATAEPIPARGRYAISYGTYAKRDNAEKLVADLKQAGLVAYADAVEANGQPALRVRTGPYADKSEAEKARLIAKRVRADAPGKLIEVDDTPARDVPASAVPARVAAGWAVQIGAFATQGDADSRRDNLRKAGFAAFVEPIKTEKGTLFRVRVGPQAQRAGAEKLKLELKEKLKLDGTIVTQP
jgi:DedD protein